MKKILLLFLFLITLSKNTHTSELQQSLAAFSAAGLLLFYSSYFIGMYIHKIDSLHNLINHNLNLDQHITTRLENRTHLSPESFNTMVQDMKTTINNNNEEIKELRNEINDLNSSTGKGVVLGNAIVAAGDGLIFFRNHLS